MCSSSRVMLGCALTCCRQGQLHRGAGGIGGMHDAAVAVAAFAREVEFLGMQFVVAELYALLEQPFDRRFAMFHDETGHAFAAQAGPGDQGVLDMRLD